MEARMELGTRPILSFHDLACAAKYHAGSSGVTRHHRTRVVPSAVRRLYRRVMPAPTPVHPARSAETWDAEYEEGRWDYLDTVEEMARYMVLLGYAGYAVPRPKVLDVGCGHGRLLSVFQRLPFDSYFGLDISQAAIDRAVTAGVPNAHFEVGSFDDWAPADRFDVVVFNESLGYARDPHALALRSLGWLNDHGLLLISLFRHRDGRESPSWTAIKSDPAFDLVDSTIVENRRGVVWDVAALRCEARATSTPS